MPRAPFQILVFPYRTTVSAAFEYAVFKRSDAHYWQAIAGGGEQGESPLIAARREANEEAAIPQSAPYLQLSSMNSVPVVAISGFLWGEDVLVIPEYCFAVDASNCLLKLSQEHEEMRWTTYEDANSLLKWDSNRNALWELNFRLTGRS